MDERVMQFRVGVMVLATLIITVTLALMFGELPAISRGTNTIYVRFSDAPGVTRDTPVRKSGILIGRVSAIRFADDDRTVLVTAEIDRARKIYTDETCRISNSLIGIGSDTVLEIVPGLAPGKTRTPLGSGGDRVPEPAARAVAQESDRVEELPRRPGGNQDSHRTSHGNQL